MSNKKQALHNNFQKLLYNNFNHPLKQSNRISNYQEKLQIKDQKEKGAA